MEVYDAIVIGAGRAGSRLAIALARAGWQVAVVERAHVGGSWVNLGCTPSKTMAASARMARMVREASAFGISTGAVTIDVDRVLRRRQTVIDGFRQEELSRLASAESLTLVMGQAEFVGRRHVRVTRSDGHTQILGADRVFVCAGTRPAVPDIPGLAGAPYLDSSSVLGLNHVPENLLVLGGGCVGIEFGQTYQRLGARVTIVQRGKQLLDREDADVAEAVRRILMEDGIQVWLESDTQLVSTANGHVKLTVRCPTGVRNLTGSHLLVACGRAPNSNGLNLAAAGVQTDVQGFVRVNDRLETNVPGIYALGDIKGPPFFTHVAADDCRIVEANLVGEGNASPANRLVPYLMYLDPPLGRVGLSEERARLECRHVRSFAMPIARIARSVEIGEDRGLIKAVVNSDTRQVLGAAILGTDAGELLAAFQVAMMAQVPYDRLRGALFAHSTLAEAMNALFAE